MILNFTLMCLGKVYSFLLCSVVLIYPTGPSVSPFQPRTSFPKSVKFLIFFLTFQKKVSFHLPFSLPVGLLLCGCLEFLLPHLLSPSPFTLLILPGELLTWPPTSCVLACHPSTELIVTKGIQTGALWQSGRVGWGGRERGGSFRREGRCVHLWLILTDVWQKATRFCEAITL